MKIDDSAFLYWRSAMDLEAFGAPPGVVLETGPILAEGWDAAPEEIALAEGFAAARRREFLTGRTLARRALRRLGVEAPAILPDPKRCPLWPSGMAGSITHTRDFCAAAACRKADHAGLGLDVTPVDGMQEAFAVRVLTPEELAAWEKLPAGEGTGGRIGRLALVFSIKEAFYKLQYPRTGQWLGFRQASVEAEEGCRFEVRLLTDLGPGFRRDDRYPGSYLFGGGVAAALMLLKA